MRYDLVMHVTDGAVATCMPQARQGVHQSEGGCAAHGEDLSSLVHHGIAVHGCGAAVACAGGGARASQIGEPVHLRARAAMEHCSTTAHVMSRQLLHTECRIDHNPGIYNIEEIGLKHNRPHTCCATNLFRSCAKGSRTAVAGPGEQEAVVVRAEGCLLYTSDAADE